MSTMMKESAADSKTAAFDVADIKSVASDVLFTNDASTCAANDNVLSDSVDDKSVGSTDTSALLSDFELVHYRSLITSLVDKRRSYDRQLSSHDDHLYDLLTDCLSLSLNPQRHDTTSALWRAIADQREAAGATRKIQANTRFEATIVRFVFNESLANDVDSISRSKVYDYSVTLTRAIDEGVLPDNFASWVKQNGGIDNIRRNYKGDTERKLVSVSKQQTLHLGKYIDKETAIGTGVTIQGVYEGNGRVRVIDVVCDGR